MAAVIDGNIAQTHEQPEAFIDRVAAQALTVKPLKLLLTLLALPFYLLGWIVGLLWLVIVFAFGAVRVGFADARHRFDARPARREVT